MKPEDLSAIEARCKAASPGPWTGEHADVWGVEKCLGKEQCPYEDCDGSEPEHEFHIADCNQDYERENDNDCTFIAHARTDLPRAVERIRELEAALREAMPLLRRSENGHHYCRSCPAGTANGWRHYDGCRIAEHDADVDRVVAAARAALEGKP